MKQIGWYICNFLWDICENTFGYILKWLGTFLTPKLTTKLHKWIADLDDFIQKKIDAKIDKD